MATSNGAVATTPQINQSRLSWRQRSGSARDCANCLALRAWRTWIGSSTADHTRPDPENSSCPCSGQRGSDGGMSPSMTLPYPPSMVSTAPPRVSDQSMPVTNRCAKAVIGGLRLRSANNFHTAAPCCCPAAAPRRAAGRTCRRCTWPDPTRWLGWSRTPAAGRRGAVQTWISPPAWPCGRPVAPLPRCLQRAARAWPWTRLRALEEQAALATGRPPSSGSHHLVRHAGPQPAFQARSSPFSRKIGVCSARAIGVPGARSACARCRWQAVQRAPRSGRAPRLPRRHGKAPPACRPGGRRAGAGQAQRVGRPDARPP